MSRIIDQTAPNQLNGEYGEAKTHAIISYLLLIIGLFTAIPMLIGAIWAMVKKGSAKGTIYHSHYCNATRVFWWTLAWTIIGCITIFILIGYLIFAITWVWALYRLINGFAKIMADQPYPL